MNTLLILLAIYIMPIFIIFLCMYLLMDKGQSIKEFIEEIDIDSTFVILTGIPIINMRPMTYCIVNIICIKFADCRK